MFAYTRQMLSGSAVDAEDAVQEIFVRAYSGLRSSDRELALRAWLYRIAHNRCIDELRRPQSVATETIPATVPNSRQRSRSRGWSSATRSSASSPTSSACPTSRARPC